MSWSGPINESDENRRNQEFFRPEFAAQRLGKPGYWQGGAMVKLALENPVQSEVFARLVQGRTPEGERLRAKPLTDAPQVKGWHLKLVAENRVSTLWALSPELVRARLRLAHNRAVKAAVADFERALNGHPRFDNYFAPDRKLALFAAFQSGASREQLPQLKTDLFLFNLVLHRGGGITNLTVEPVDSKYARMQSIYQQALRREVLWVLGDQMRVPEELHSRLQPQLAHGDTKLQRAAFAKPLQGSQLFAAWRESAKQYGWGPERVGELLLRARSQTNWRNWAKDWGATLRFGALWTRQSVRSAKSVIDRTLQTHDSKAPAPPKEKDQDKGMTQSY